MLKNTLMAALDIGTSKVSCIIAEKGPKTGTFMEGCRILGAGSHGFAPGFAGAADIREIGTGIRKAVDAAERMADQRIGRVILSVPSRFLSVRRVAIDMDIHTGRITQEDVRDSLAEGMRLACPEGHEMIHVLPVAFNIDGTGPVSDPVGFSGAGLSTEMLGISIRDSVRENLDTMAGWCGLKVDAFAAASVAAAGAVLLEDEKALGVLLVDIGASSSGYAVYDNGVLVDTGGVPCGGVHITRDIARIFGTSLVDAEKLKTLYGAALIGSGDEHSGLDFPQLGDYDNVSRASRADLCEVIIPRMEEIFELVAERRSRGVAGRVNPGRAVLTGGGSLLVGAQDLAGRVLGMRARTASPLPLSGAGTDISGPGFSVCTGLIAGRSWSAGCTGMTFGHDVREKRHGRSWLSAAAFWLRTRF